MVWYCDGGVSGFCVDGSGGLGGFGGDGGMGGWVIMVVVMVVVVRMGNWLWWWRGWVWGRCGGREYGGGVGIIDRVWWWW